MNQKDPTAAAHSQRPRSPRVPVEFSLDVEGETVDGKPFQLKAQAIKISRGGATIVMDAEVSVGTRLKLTPPFGHKLDAEVNGVWHDQIDGGVRVGVRLLDPNGWFAE